MIHFYYLHIYIIIYIYKGHHQRNDTINVDNSRKIIGLQSCYYGNAHKLQNKNVSISEIQRNLLLPLLRGVVMSL